MREYETVIGLEVHCELATESKIFCSCSAKFGGEQNEHVCPACCGMPGMLPVTNKRVVELGATAGMMLNCHINRTTTFDKKSYYYPDLPCSYQVTQWFAPIAVRGKVRISTSKGEKDIRIKQIHMEEDAGKLIHDDWMDASLVDFNRTSVPLIEIVSQPDLSSAEEVVAYLERLRSLLRFARVSEARMEQGSMRCDVNLSVRPKGSTELGVRTEMKNMNSVSAIERAIDYEVARHIDAIENGTEELVQETRRWDDIRGMSFSMRNKETAGDYRYFPDPNLMPVVIDDEWYNNIRESLPELPELKNERYVNEIGLSEKDASVLTKSRALCDCFEQSLAVCGLAKESANWIISDCMNILKKKKMNQDDLDIDGGKLGELISLVNEGTISRANARKVLEVLFDGPIDIGEYIKEKKLVVNTDQSFITDVISKVLEDEAQTVTDYLNGREKAFNVLIGKCMKELKGNCDVKALRELLEKAIRES